MPRPYSRFHAQYLKRYRDSGKGSVIGDSRGRVVSALHKDGRIFNIRLEVHAIQDDSSNKTFYSGAAAGRRRWIPRVGGAAGMRSSGACVLHAWAALHVRCCMHRRCGV